MLELGMFLGFWVLRFGILFSVPLAQQLATGCKRFVTLWFAAVKSYATVKAVITKRRPMKRLPGYDSRTSRAELTAFCSLGLVGTALVTAAVSDALKFAAARDDIVK